MMLKFGTDGLRGKVGESPLRVGEVLNIGYAIGRYFRDLGKGNVVIGRDTRESGRWITYELTDGLTCAGCTVYDAAVVTTPMLARAVKTGSDLDGGIMVTASHNNCDYNGIKVFDYDGEKLLPEEEGEIARYHAKPMNEMGGISGVLSLDALTPYLDGLREYLGDADLSGLMVLTDSAEGAAHGLAKKVFEHFGVKSLELGNLPDGKNINETGALYPGFLADRMPSSLRNLGLALDGDADRVVLVDKTGRIWNGDRILAMLATHLPELGLTVGKVVMTQYGNGGAMQYLREAGIGVETVLVGDREVYEKCCYGRAELGGETAGHIIIPSWLSSSDGIFVALLTLRLMQKTGKRLDELWPDYAELPNRQWDVRDARGVVLEDIPGWTDMVAASAAYLPAGRIFVRRSGTETDKIRILVESQDGALCRIAGDRLAIWLGDYLAQK